MHWIERNWVRNAKKFLIVAMFAVAFALAPHGPVQANTSELPPSQLVQPNGTGGFTVSPSSLTNPDLKAQEDTANLGWALNYAKPGGTVYCRAGTFLIAQPIVVANFQGSFVGEGKGRTFLVGRGSVLASDAAFPLVDDQEAVNVGLDPGLFPSLFLFTTSDLTSTGDFTLARSTVLRMTHMTLQMSGKTAAPSFGSNNKEGELLAHVRVFGKDGRWFDPNTFLENGSFKPGLSLTSPIDLDDPGGPKINEVSHAEISFVDVHFQGENLDRASPNVFAGLFVMGSNTFLGSNPLRKPLNLNLLIRKCLFDNLSIGINSPTAYSPGQDAWAFGPDARPSTLAISHNTFRNMRLIAHIADDLGDATVTFRNNVVNGTTLGVGYSGNYLRGLAGWGFMPVVADTSRVVIRRNEFLVDGDRAFGVESAAVALVEGLPGFEVIRSVIANNRLRIDELGFYGIFSIGAHQAAVFANRVTGNGAAAINAAFGDGWNIHSNELRGFKPEGTIAIFGDTGVAAHDVVLWQTNNSKVRERGPITVFDSGANNTILVR